MQIVNAAPLAFPKYETIIDISFLGSNILCSYIVAAIFTNDFM